MINRHLLDELAERHGVATAYTSAAGELITVDDQTIILTLTALGIAVPEDPSDDQLTTLLYQDYLDRASRPLPRCVVGKQGEEIAFVVHVHDGDPAKVHIELEDGSRREAYQDANDAPAADVAGTFWGEASFHTPGDLPLGYHRLHLDSPGTGKKSCQLIVTPQRVTTADPYLERPASGVMAQLYSVRSAESWGMGDFHDLGELAETLFHNAGADFLLINPLHAAEPFPPVEDSPYLPSTRRFTNPIYLRVEDVPELELLDADLRADVTELAAEFQAANRTPDEIDRNEIYGAKLQVLRELFTLEFTEERRQAFVSYARAEGPGLVEFARWCANADRVRLSGSRHAQHADIEELTRFYSWLQFLCDEQFAAAQERARAAGMRIGIITDLAVGIHPGGADAVNLAEYLAPQASVGAPPDPYNQLGQDWSQPPWHPVRLAEAGYEPWRELLRTQLRHCGGMRLDHILGMFRLYWIPRRQPASTGTYVHYDPEAMLGILALEAERAGNVLIGEDMGTVEPWVAEELASRGILGTTVIWFERDPHDESRPRRQSSYRRYALGAVGTHDMPPTLSYIRGGHITLRDGLGVLTRPADEESSEDLAWQAQVFGMLADAGYLDRTEATAATWDTARPSAEQELGLMTALHEFVAQSPAALTVTNLVDLVGDLRAQNQPGTTGELYPNWRLPLCNNEGQPVLIAELTKQPMFAPIARASRRPR